MVCIMSTHSIPDFLRTAADVEIIRLEELLPPQPEQRFLLFLEIQRVFDVACIQHSGRKNEDLTVHHDLDILRWGMNIAASKLLIPLKTPLGLPLTETSEIFRSTARNILWNFGAVALARRAADMVQQNFMFAEKSCESVNFRDTGTGPSQYMDHVEFELLRQAEADLTKEPVSPQGWAICIPKVMEEKLKAPGAYYANPSKQHDRLLSEKRLEELMVPLIFPWRIPQGTLTGYGALEEVDEHFLWEAHSIIDDFRNDAGIHPDVNFGGFSGSDLIKIVTVLLSFYHKHVAFVLFARKHFPEINVQESFTIWGPRDDLCESVFLALDIPKERIEAVIKCLTLTTDDLSRLERETTPLLPMLIDLGNGFCLKPISCLMRNPFFAFLKISQWRNPLTRNLVSSSREAWFRQDVYSLFGGSRYWCVHGSIVLRNSGKRLTDVDAAVFDRTTGELVLFQLKWQDYSTNSIHELRSKASNLASEIDVWGDSVQEWLKVTDPKEVAQALRIKLRGSQRIISIFLIGVSRSIARTHGYGFPITNPFLSVASWPQFKRVRAQIGPAPRVLSKLHELLRSEEQLTLATAKPHPVTVEFPGCQMHFENLWNTWDENDKKN